MTTKQKPPPVSEARLAEIKKEWGDSGRYHQREVRDLLALIDYERARADEAETWCARLAHDREGETALMAAGVAKALAALQSEVDDLKKSYHHVASALTRDAWQTGEDLLRHVKEACGPAELPPHEVTLARLRRLEEALRRVGDYPISGSAHEVREIVRAVLEDVTP